jgi:ABC-type transporter Mla maintaining outer membrane lipid asymmetry ATPase subunit MlaF
LLDLAIQHKQPLLMVGPSGTGKTCIIAAHLLSGKGLPQELWMPVAITLSARTSANMLQEQVGQLMLQQSMYASQHCAAHGSSNMPTWNA